MLKNRSMKSRRLVNNYIYNTAYQILSIAVQLVTTPYIARVLGAAGIGIYQMTLANVTYFVLLSGLGTTLYGQREIAYAQDDPEKRTRVFQEIVALRMLSTFVWLGTYLLIFCTKGEYAQVYRILILEALAAAFDISWFFMGMENFRIIVLRNTVIKLLGVMLVFLLVHSPEDVLIYTWCMTLPTFLGHLSLWPGIKKYLVRIRRTPADLLQGILPHLKPNLMLFLPQVAVEVYTVLDKTMLGALSSGVDQVGYYSQAQKVIRIILVIITSLGTVMLPAVSAAFSRGEKEEIQRSILTAFRFVFMLGFAMLFGICGIADRFVPVFFGAGYDQVVSLIWAISPIMVIIGISNVIGKQYLLPTKQQNLFTVSIVTGACVNVVMNFLLIPRLDAVGASAATVIAELSVTCVQIMTVRKQLPLTACILPFFRYLAMGLVMLAAVRLAGRAAGYGAGAVVLMILAGGVVYLLELVVTRDEMLYRLKSFTKRKKN